MGTEKPTCPILPLCTLVVLRSGMRYIVERSWISRLPHVQQMLFRYLLRKEFPRDRSEVFARMQKLLEVAHVRAVRPTTLPILCHQSSLFGQI